MQLISKVPWAAVIVEAVLVGCIKLPASRLSMPLHDGREAAKFCCPEIQFHAWQFTCKAADIKPPEQYTAQS